MSWPDFFNRYINKKFKRYERWSVKPQYFTSICSKRITERDCMRGNIKGVND